MQAPRPGFEAAAPEALFEVRLPNQPLGSPFSLYDVAADGKRFLVNTSGGESGAGAPLTVVTNWLKAVGSRQWGSAFI